MLSRFAPVPGELPRRKRDRTDIEQTIVSGFVGFFAEFRFSRLRFRIAAVCENRCDRRKQNRNAVSKFPKFHLLLCQGTARRRNASQLFLRARGRGRASVAANYQAPKK
jgi:hypothetical protein